MKGFGPTFASKLLHFAVPQVFGALDSRLVRIFGNAAFEYPLLDLYAEKCNKRWQIPAQKGWPGEYGTWIRILNYLADRLNREGKSCPHPENYYKTGLREKGVWLPADVETSLFSYASLQLKPLPGEFEDSIGYTFRNKKILTEAITRRAFLNESPSKNDECMDPLALLGDAVLDTISILKLYESGIRTPKDLSESKSDQVKHEKTRAFFNQHNLQNFIFWSEGEKKQRVWEKGFEAPDAVAEALIGAIFLDAERRGWNGMTVVNDMLERMNFFNVKTTE